VSRSTYTQDNRLIRFHTPLGPDVLLLQSFTGTEGISRLFKFEVELLSENGKIVFSDIVGNAATISVYLAHGSPRYFNGLVSRFRQADADGNFFHYTAEIVPTLWLLDRIVDCRIFQQLTPLGIIEQLLAEVGITDYRNSVHTTLPTLEYCVQYRETSFNFISRLMEQYGIFYFFEHESEKHTVVFADAKSAHAYCPGQRSARLDITAGGPDDADVITEWSIEQEFRSGKYSLADFDFEKPTLDLSSSVTSTINVPAMQSCEIYDYPGGFKTKEDAATAVRVRIEQEESVHKRVYGAGVCRAFSAGYKFEFEHPFRHDANMACVLTEVQHSASVGSNYTGGDEIPESYSNTFCCIPYAVPFRPLSTSRKPVVQGLQTAIVVGPPGEEIYVDKHGRVKVQFHWDRHGQYNEKSSCWVRVATMAAGKQWGGILIPRIGWEVVVAFEEGDPDRPLIVGSVYNAGQTPPYTLPDEKTKSTLKTNSSKGGGGFNEIRIDDKKGNEQIFIHGEKDLHLRLKNDAFETILNERHVSVKKDFFSQTGADNHIYVKGDQNEKVDGTASLKTGQNLLQKVGMKFAADAGTEIHLKSGTTLVLETGTSLTLKVGGNFININSAGVFITGTMVMINSGGAAGPGSGCSPTNPKAVKEADTAQAGSKGEMPPRKSPPKPQQYSPGALAMKKAAEEGADFCDISGN
jgi:type VI secretion system secreted protein VgrG